MGQPGAGQRVADVGGWHLSRAQKAGEVMNEVCNTERDRFCVPRTSSDTSTGHFGLPNEMVERAVTRLGWLGLIYAATLNVVHWTRTYSLPAHLFSSAPSSPLVKVALAAGTVLGLAICALAWSRRVPAKTMLDIGLMFEVAAAFCISVMENSNPLLAAGWVRGVCGLARSEEHTSELQSLRHL